MAQLFEDTVQQILSHFKGEHVSKVVLAGKAGAGKTWVARKVCESAFKQGFSYGSIWISPDENPEKKDLLEIIASQLSLSPYAEEWDDNEDIEEVKDNEDTEPGTLEQRILDRLEILRIGKSKNQAPKPVKETPEDMEEKKFEEPAREVATRKLTYLLVVLDDVSEEEDSIASKLERILKPNPLKILITRKESRDSSVGSTSERKVDSIQPDDTNTIQLERLRTEEAVALLKECLQEQIKSKVSKDQLEAIAEKSLGIPAVVILLAEALNHINVQDRVRALENAVEDATDLKVEDATDSKGKDIIGVLRFVYEMLPEGVTRSCYWLSRQLFTYRDAVQFNELIAFWIMEGCFDHHNRIEEAYEEGHYVLMELKDRRMLKGHSSNYVRMERAMSKLPDERRDGFSGAAKLGLADVLRSDGLGRIVLADGMIRTVCKDKEKKELSTLIIDGSHLWKEDSKRFFRSLKGVKVLAVLNPMFEHLPPGLTELKDLQVLVLRGCQHLKKADEIRNLTKLSVLEISGASLLNLEDDAHKDIFKDMTNLQSVNLSGLHTTSIPDSLVNQDKEAQLRFLVLRACPKLIDLPTLKNMKKLEMVDLFGSASFHKFSDANFSTLTDLKTLNVSGTKVSSLPIYGKVGGLRRILLKNCSLLNMIRPFGKGTDLEVLDISGSEKIADLNSAHLDKQLRFRILDLSKTDIKSLPPRISSNLSHLHLSGCEKIEKLPSTVAFPKIVELDLSGATTLAEVEDKSFEHLKFLRHLNLSSTKIKQLPTLSHLVELRSLLLKGCEELTELHGLTPLKKLEVLDLSGCSSLTITREESFSCMSRLEKLDLSTTMIEALPENCLPSNLRHLILRECKMLKQLPSLQSLSNLEELHLCGAESLSNFKTDFLSHMSKLKILNLSKTHPDELSSLSLPTNLTELYLSGCSCGPSDLQNLQGLTQLEVLDLSGTRVQSLPSLENYSKLRKLLLRNCSNLGTLTNLKSLSDLEVLDLSGTGLTQFPDEVKYLTTLGKLHLQSLKQAGIDWLRIKYLHPLQLPQVQVSKSEITAPATVESQSWSILVSGTEFFSYLEENSELWNTCFKEFHFSVWLLDEKGGDEIMEVPGDRSLCKYLNPHRRFPHSENCSVLEIHGSTKESKESHFFPIEMTSALSRAQYISVIDNGRISCISELGKEHVGSIKSCWFERCQKLESIFAGKKDTSTWEGLESLYLCSLPSLVRLCDEKLHSGILSDIKRLYLDCCPKLVNVFSPLKLPANLENLTVKFCYKLETLFEGDQSAEYKMPNLQTLDLLDLPELKRIGAAMPALETLKVRRCPNLQDLCSRTLELNTFSNLKNLHLDYCPELIHLFSPSELPMNLETLKVKSCSKLKTLFKVDGSALLKVPKLKSLELFDLPELEIFGAAMPPLETLKVIACVKLHDSYPSARTVEIYSCPNLQNGCCSSQMQVR